jgi:hypothetical protein
MFQMTNLSSKSIHLILAAGFFLAGSLPVVAQTPEVENSEVASSSLNATQPPANPPSYGPQATQGPTQAYSYTIQRTHSYWATHGFDLAASVNGRYQQTVTDQQPALTNPTEGLGVLVNVREQVVPWFGLEMNYSYSRYSERFNSAATGLAIGRLQQDQHEATAGYILHIKAPGIQPFVTLGGGAINFRGTKANPQFDNQWRGTYMYEVGFDFVSRKQPHFGVRVQEHGLFYKAPDFHVASLRSNGYIHQAMPSAGVFFRF